MLTALLTVKMVKAEKLKAIKPDEKSFLTWIYSAKNRSIEFRAGESLLWVNVTDENGKSSATCVAKPQDGTLPYDLMEFAIKDALTVHAMTVKNPGCAFWKK